MNRSSGVTKDAGVRVTQATDAAQVEQGPFGGAGFPGIYERGPVGELISCLTPEETERRLGGRMDGTIAPDAAASYWQHAENGGALYAVRVTDGLEEDATLMLYSRTWGLGYTSGTVALPPVTETSNRDQRLIPVLKITAKDPGRWSGRRREYSGSFTCLGVPGAPLTETALTTGTTMKKDELKGGTLAIQLTTFPTTATTTYEITGNTTAGVISVASNKTMFTDQGMGAGTAYWRAIVDEVDLANGARKGLSAVVGNGTQYPSTEFSLTLYWDGIPIPGGAWPDLSMDPTSSHYVEKVVNKDDQYDIEVEDQLTAGIEVYSGLRPANAFSMVDAVDSTTLTINPYHIYSCSSGDVVAKSIAPHADVLSGVVPLPPYRLTLTYVRAVAEADDAYTVAATTIRDGKTFIEDLENFAIGAFAGPNYEIETYTPANKLIPTIVLYRTARPVDASTIVIDVLPIDTEAAVGADIFPDDAGAPYTSLRVKSATYKTFTVETGDPSAVATADVLPSLTGTAAAAGGPPVEFASLATKTLIFSMNGLEEITITFSDSGAGATTLADVLTDINGDADVIAVYGDGASASIATADDTNHLVLTAPKGPDGGPGSFITIGAGTGNAILGFTAATTYGTEGTMCRMEANQVLSGGYDGDVPDVNDFLAVWAVGTSPYNDLSDVDPRSLMLATPGITTLLSEGNAALVERAADAYAEAKFHTNFPECPSSKVDPSSVRTYFDTTVGRSDFVGAYWPSMLYIKDPDGDGAANKLVSSVAMVIGEWAKIATGNQHYVQPPAGIQMTLPEVVAFPSGYTTHFGEVLTPAGINTIRKKSGQFVIWGGRGLWVDANWKWLTHRLQVNHWSWTLGKDLERFLFMVNTAEGRASVASVLQSYFELERLAGAVDGAKPYEGFSVKVNESNNPAWKRALGIMAADVAVSIPYFAEQIRLTLLKTGPAVTVGS